MEISELLIAAREAAGMTQAGVAAARHVSRGAHSQIELAGARPSWDTIDSFAKAINASVTVQFELANGAVVSGRCAGTHQPTLADDLFADADRARRGALDAGWVLGRDERVAPVSSGYGEYATVHRLVGIIEPSNWALQSSLTMLMSMAAAAGIDQEQSSDFTDAFYGLLQPPPGYEDDPEVFDVTAKSQIALNALLDATRRAAFFALDMMDIAMRRAEILPVRHLKSYLASGAPGAQEVMNLVKRISASADWRLAILRDAGYLYGEPADYTQLPHRELEEGY